MPRSSIGGKGRRPRPEDDFALRLAAALATKSDVFVDIGAYTGIFSLVAAASDPDIRVHAFEIVPAVVEMLDANIERNGMQDRIEVHAEGIGDPSTVMLVPEGSGGSALPSFYSSRMSFDHGTKVAFRTQDELAEIMPSGARASMKIDVEGTEDAIFRHGQGFLGRYRPDMICEVLDGVADGPALTKLLEPHGYTLRLITDTGLQPHDRITPNSRFRDWFITCRPEPEVKSLLERTDRG